MAKHKICAVDGCGNPQHARGFCGKHNYKFVKYGDPLAGRTSASPGEPLRWIEESAGHQGEECLPWPFEVSQWGYGTVRHNGKKRVASRVMCEFVHGLPSSPDLDAAHSCNFPRCCNPKHLRWATRRENNDDKIENGTAMRGEKVVFAKLTEPMAAEIQSLGRQKNMRQREIAEKFGITQSQVSRIVAGKRWGWLQNDIVQRPGSDSSL
jgi:predicted XRE-type DNA-binding protein